MSKPRTGPRVTRVKKVGVKTGTTGKTPDEKVVAQKKVKNTCDSNATFKQSQACQDAMAVWTAKTDALEKNQKDKANLYVQLRNILDQEVELVFEYDVAADAFASAVRTVAGTDHTVVTAMGLELRSGPVKKDDPFTPTGLKIDVLKGKKIPKLVWDKMPGAVLYVAQMSVDPATDTSWQVIFGKGRSRIIPPLVHGQHYLLRVAAVGRDGKQSAWSTTVSLVG
jgi:hypothetical protein